MPRHIRTKPRLSSQDEDREEEQVREPRTSKAPLPKLKRLKMESHPIETKGMTRAGSSAVLRQLARSAI